MRKMKPAGKKKEKTGTKKQAVKKKNTPEQDKLKHLKASLALLEKVKDNCVEPFCVVDKSGVIIDANEPLLNLLAVEKKKLIGKSYLLLYPETERHPDDFKAKFKSQSFPKSIETEISFGGKKAHSVKEENRFVKAGASSFLIKKFAFVSKASAKKPGGMGMLQSLLNTSSDPAFILDDNFNILDGNKKLGFMLGLPNVKNLVGHDITSYIKNIDKKKFAESILADELRETQYLFITRFGEEIPAQISLSPIELEPGNIVYFGFVKDQSKSIQAEETIKYFQAGINELNQSKEKLFNVISHDLRSPFQGLISAAELFRKSAGDLSREEISEFSLELEKTLRSQYELLNNLFEWSRIERGLLSFHPQKVQLRELVQQSAEALSARAENKKINIENNVNSDIEVYADDTAIKLVLQNIYSNAIKFTPVGGKVSIFAKETPTEVEISVLDTGVGISKENLKKLFRSDYALSIPGTQNEKGTGLGLILCRELISTIGGRIWVESSEGEGSVFTFTLPKNS